MEWRGGSVEPEQVSLLIPCGGQTWKAEQFLTGEVTGLLTFEDCGCDVRCQEGAPDGSRDETLIDVLFCRDLFVA